MINPTEALARAEATTEGPWEVDPYSNGVLTQSGQEDQFGDPLRVAETVYMAADREFISAARNDVPALARAVLAVAELHQPFEWSFGYEPVRSCRECARLGASEKEAEWPCPTILAMREAGVEV